jgi:hypothetical protein
VGELSSITKVFYACVTPTTKVLTLSSATATCPGGGTKIHWNQTGPQGPAGPQGAPGTLIVATYASGPFTFPPNGQKVVSLTWSQPATQDETIIWGVTLPPTTNCSFTTTATVGSATLPESSSVVSSTTSAGDINLAFVVSGAPATWILPAPGSSTSETMAMNLNTGCGPVDVTNFHIDVIGVQ